MILTSVYLYRDVVECRTDAALTFRNQTRFLCNYVQRYVKLLKVQTNRFNRICVVCKGDATESSYINSSKTLVVEVPFDIAEYEKYREDELPEYFISLLEVGVKKCSRDRHVPADIFRKLFSHSGKIAIRTNGPTKLKCFARLESSANWIANSTFSALA